MRSTLHTEDAQTVRLRRRLRIPDQDLERAQWLETYVTDDKLFCVYVADDEATVKEHAQCGGFPADAVLQVRTIMDPTTGE